MKLLKYGSLIFFVFQLLNMFYLSDPNLNAVKLHPLLDTIANYLLLFSFSFGAYYFHKFEKDCLISDKEIIQTINGNVVK